MHGWYICKTQVKGLKIPNTDNTNNNTQQI